MTDEPQFEPASAAEHLGSGPDLDDENGITAQAVQQGADDFDPDAPLPDDGSGQPLLTQETLSVEDDAEVDEAADEEAEVEGAGLTDED